MTDRRLLPANGRVAHVSLRNTVDAKRYVSGEPCCVVDPVADLLAQPGGARDRQLLHGEELLALDRHDGAAFVQASKDGYCGYVLEAAIGRSQIPTHWVSAAATHLYQAPDIKAPEIVSLSLGSRLSIKSDQGRFLETDRGFFVPAAHLRKIGDWEEDPVSVAERLLGSPYLWGGNSRAGIDCSGLVQIALQSCGIACPGDSDMQEKAVGARIHLDTPPRRGDLLFWKGHVALARNDDEIIHANAHHMAVVIEKKSVTIARIIAQGYGPVRAIRRY
ncbi:MAG: NlpC/P60 family protein [Albidovulum sp.]